jgi:hypothetical protein
MSSFCNEQLEKKFLVNNAMVNILKNKVEAKLWRYLLQKQMHELEVTWISNNTEMHNYTVYTYYLK